MRNNSLEIYLEINKSNFIFFVGKYDEKNNLKKIYELKTQIIGLEDNRISDYDKVFNLMKENIYLIEKKFNFTFKEIVIVLDNLNPSFLCLSGYKKLNGSQILKENINYILTTLKSYVEKIETNKTILHIFNSKYILDNKQIDNLPIGLFGDLYTHELSFALININNFKNLENIFANCNLKIKKILLKSFIKGANISKRIKSSENFFHINIQEDSSKIFYFENNSLKFEQNFKFGSNIILQDVSKITSLKISTVKKILSQIQFDSEINEDELVEEVFFNDEAYKKLRKKLIYEIIEARVKEISEILIFNNINIHFYCKGVKTIFFDFDNNSQPQSLKTIYKALFSTEKNLEVNFLDEFSHENLIETASELVHFGWKKEAIPVSRVKKSILARFFDNLFN